jgi:RNA polymerase sigma factor (sigma-70 family)
VICGSSRWFANLADDATFAKLLGHSVSCAVSTASILHTGGRQFFSDLSTILQSSMRQIHLWRVPPHWARSDWFQEMRAHTATAVWQAVCDYDASYGVPLPAFIYLRVLASARTRFRQEWGYAARCSPQAEGEERATVTRDSAYPPTVSELLPHALAELSEPARRLMEQLFWAGDTEAEIGQRLGVSHQAVSKRKKLVLQDLRTRLGLQTKGSSAGCLPHRHEVDTLQHTSEPGQGRRDFLRKL